MGGFRPLLFIYPKSQKSEHVTLYIFCISLSLAKNWVIRDFVNKPRFYTSTKPSKKWVIRDFVNKPEILHQYYCCWVLGAFNSDSLSCDNDCKCTFRAMDYFQDIDFRPWFMWNLKKFYLSSNARKKEMQCKIILHVVRFEI